MRLELDLLFKMMQMVIQDIAIYALGILKSVPEPMPAGNNGDIRLCAGAQEADFSMVATLSAPRSAQNPPSPGGLQHARVREPWVKAPTPRMKCFKKSSRGQINIELCHYFGQTWKSPLL